MGQSKPTIALRPFLPTDAPAAAAIFEAAIAELAAEDYSEAQLAAWMASLNEEELAARMADQLALVATVGGQVAGFAALADNRKIDLLYVHPELARQGVATQLIEALEKLAAARGASTLEVEASDTAEPFFQRRGYSPEQRNTKVLGGEWLGNTTMRKALAGQKSKDHSR
ncbi:GNAT family N-acetyltransferase [Blastochloris viridis]|uniref:Acetyltransferase n=1 Tax=Blastochloris viridis TaxID=1079 RepID=A0A0H5B7G9_BLAVI|nr:GNAT family N-acetyltransferase [Blastochloris viridis]ALK08594.1 putative N-acetyltransferase YafP [Blastochloris viridis]BAR98117.1 acetyltransferase [Blastochloris viridis]CUU41257.1 putative acyltransferase [Blastochloris viridis]